MSLIDGLTLSDRAGKLRDEFFECPVYVSAERAALATESWKETEGEPLDIRRAKLLKKVCEGVALGIHKGVRLAGGQTTNYRGIHVHPEFSTMWAEWLLDSVKEDGTGVEFSGSAERGTISLEDVEVLKEVVKYWKPRTPGTRIREAVKEIFGRWYDDCNRSGGTLLNDGSPFGGLCPTFERVAKEGMRSIIKEAQDRIQDFKDNMQTDVEKLHFWQASIIACEAAITVGKRYANLAKEMAATEEDPEWRAELLEIAKACEWVSENPARTFREAMQSYTLLYTALSLELWCPPDGVGRMDRELYQLYQQDLAEGRLTIEEAAELIADFYVFCIRQEWMLNGPNMGFVQKGQLISVSLCGTDAKGEDVSNELSYLFLHVMGEVKTPEPHLVVGWHKGIPNWLMQKALETNWKCGGGVPQFQNIDVVVDVMHRRGIAVEQARDWTTHGCSQMMAGDSRSTMLDCYPNVALPLDLALHNGIASKRGLRVGVETGDPRNFKTFDEVYEAYKTQAEYMLKRVIWHENIADRLRGQYFRTPLHSVMLRAPLEKGMDYSVGGLHHYKMVYAKDRGYVPTADSLIAIKKLVFEEKKLTMAELLEAVDNNFAGDRGEEIRQMVLSAPKYGNDIDECDIMVRDLASFCGGVITSIKNVWGDYWAVNRNGEVWHTMAGKLLAAMPNGRLSGGPLADASLSPSQGMDRCGPTAVLNSALKADFKQLSPAAIITLRFSAPLLANTEMRDKVVDLTETFFEEGGSYIQYNILDANKLRAAQRHPEKYKDLLVRVAGYSAFFITLHPEVQDELILRTEQSLAGT